MDKLTEVVMFAAIEFGVMAIAAVLWIDFDRETRSNRLVRNLQSVLQNPDPDRTGENYLTRAA